MVKVKLELLAYINLLLVVEKNIRGGICHPIIPQLKINNKDIIKIKESSYLRIIISKIET